MSHQVTNPNPILNPDPNNNQVSHQVSNIVKEVEPGEQEASPVEELKPNFIDVAVLWVSGVFSRRYPA